jgi:hypothetical protein
MHRGKLRCRNPLKMPLKSSTKPYDPYDPYAFLSERQNSSRNGEI